MEVVETSLEQALGKTSEGLAAVPPASEALAATRRKSRARGFNAGVLLGPEGEVIGGGDAPEPEGAKEFFRWLESRGCTGLETVQLRLGGGVALRATAQRVNSGEVIFSVPRTAWLTAPEEDPASVDALIWRLLTERWRNDSSEFAPFIRHLVSKKMSAHPIFWDEEEIQWLRPSREAFQLVGEQRRLAEERVGRLLARAKSEAATLVPAT